MAKGTVLDCAKQGDAEAIASLMNRTLNKKGSHVKIRRRGGEYKLLVASARTPDKTATVQWIVKGLDKLAIASIETLTIYGKSQQSNKPEWQQTVQFPLQSLEQATSPASVQPVDTQLAALEGPDVRKGSIWLSRYCLNPETTVEQLSPGAIASSSTAVPGDSLSAEEDGRSHPTDRPVKLAQSHNKPQSNFPPYAGPGVSNKPTSAAVQRAAQQAAQRAVAARRPPARQQKSPSLQGSDTPLTWIIPVAWSICLALLMGLGISSASTASAVESSDSYAICNATIGDTQNCTLAVQIVGDESYFTEIIREAVPLSPEHREAAIAHCSDYINYEAGLYDESMNVMPAVLSSSSQEIFSGVLLTNVTQKNTLDPTAPLRLACIHHTAIDEFSENADDVWFDELSSDIIPANWPSEPYAGNIMVAAFSVQDSLGAYNSIIRLFSYPLFTVAGLFVAVSIGSSYSCSTVMGLYKAAAVLGVIECFIAMLPIGWFLTLSLEILALGLTAQVVKEFDVDVQSRYGSLAFGTISLIVVRGILLSILTFVLYAITTSLVVAPAITSTI